MKVLTTALLAGACEIFLRRAYPEGEQAIPSAKRPFLHLSADQPLEPLLVAPVYHPVYTVEGKERGGAFRLGSSHYPHLKMQVIEQGHACIFSVDTHDQVRVPADHPDAPRLAALQAVNQQLKQQIESAWEEAGLLTFRGLLRQELEGA
jgi:hypothetical protein